MSRPRQRLAVDRLLREEASNLQLHLVAGKPGLLRREILEPKVQKPGHAMSGFVELVRPGRLQVLGRGELNVLQSLDPESLSALTAKIAALEIPCIAVTNGLEAPDALRGRCEENELPLLVTNLSTSTFIELAEAYLEDRLTEAMSLHGVLIDVFGVGVLLQGQSGIGKSECALDLVLRGHRLVADDIVDIRRKGQVLVGQASELIRHHMEVRGLGIINVADLFGVSAVRQQKKVELVVTLESWREEQEYDRLGVDEQYYELLDVQIPQIVLPVSPARNLTTLIEVAARNHLLKQQGHHSAIEFQKRLSKEIAMSRDPRKWGGDVE